MTGGRRLIVNADDFGFSRDVNRGIMEARQGGILTAATLMANGAAFDDAVALSRANPSLDVGCHLVLVSGPSVAHPGRNLPARVSGLLAALARGRIDPEAEMDAQIRRILAAGIRPTHLDTHKHTHLLPPVLEAVARLARRHSIPWVRRPFDSATAAASIGAPWKTRLINRGLRMLRGRFDRVLAQYRARATDHFAGFQLTGRYDAVQLAALIRELPPGVTEFMCHPGRCTDELRGAATRLKESREAELAALTSGAARQALYESGVELISFRDL